MKQFIRSLVLASMIAVVRSAFADEPSRSTPAPEDHFHERGSILGIDLKAIQVALPIFEKKGLKVDGYKIIVIEDRDLVIVLFDDPQRPPGQYGSTSRMPSFEVRLRSVDLSVVGFNFSR